MLQEQAVGLSLAGDFPSIVCLRTPLLASALGSLAAFFSRNARPPSQSNWIIKLKPNFNLRQKYFQILKTLYMPFLLIDIDRDQH